MPLSCCGWTNLAKVLSVYVFLSLTNCQALFCSLKLRECACYKTNTPTAGLSRFFASIVALRPLKYMILLDSRCKMHSFCITFGGCSRRSAFASAAFTLTLQLVMKSCSSWSRRTTLLRNSAYMWSMWNLNKMVSVVPFLVTYGVFRITRRIIVLFWKTVYAWKLPNPFSPMASTKDFSGKQK